MRQRLAMKPLASATRYGPFLAGNLKNLVLSVNGAKHLGSADGPATICGPAAVAGAPNAQAAAMPAKAENARRRTRCMIILPGCLVSSVVLAAKTGGDVLMSFAKRCSRGNPRTGKRAFARERQTCELV